MLIACENSGGKILFFFYWRNAIYCGPSNEHANWMKIICNNDAQTFKTNAFFSNQKFNCKQNFQMKNEKRNICSVHRRYIFGWVVEYSKYALYIRYLVIWAVCALFKKMYFNQLANRTTWMQSYKRISVFEYPFRVWKSSWNGNHSNEDEQNEKIKFMQQMEILMDRKFSEIGWDDKDTMHSISMIEYLLNEAVARVK